MESKQTLTILLLFTFLLTFIPLVYATEGEVNLTDFPLRLSKMLNINLFAAQLLTTGVFMCLFLFPTLLLTRELIAHLLVGLLVMCFCVAMEWLPVYILIIYILGVAVLMSGRVKGIFSGGGGE